jgi:hypothetical protein
LQGNVYLPLSIAKIRDGSDWLSALSADPFFDLDLTLDTIDLAEFAAAVKTKPDLSGTAAGKLQLSGTPVSLQGEQQFHLHDFISGGSAVLSVDFDARLTLGILNFKAQTLVRSSEPIRAEGAIPFELRKRDNGYDIGTDGPLSATLDFPAVLLANLPNYVCSGIFTRGILSGKVSASDSVSQPLITGGFNLIDGKLLRGSTVSGAVTFQGRHATIDFARIARRTADISTKGEIDFKDAAHINLALTLNRPMDVSALGPGDCVSGLELDAPAASDRVAVAVNRIDFRGGLFAPGWTIQLTPRAISDENDITQRFLFCRDGKTFSFTTTPAWFP